MRALPAALFLALPLAALAADPHSRSRPDQVAATHADFDLTVDFEGRAVTGTTTLRLSRRDARAPLILDTRGLSVRGVEASEDGERFKPAPFELGPEDPILGRALTVRLPPKAAFARVTHASLPGASGLQWLKPEQTAGKRFPFLFSQSQAIHARTWLPLQDSPGARLTYVARVRVPWPLGAVMSAGGNAERGVEVPPGEAALIPGRWREFRFKLNKPVPPYLIALAVGDLSFRSLGPRTGVYAEPETVERAAAEFSDAEGMLAAVEGLYGPYRWGRYDVLVLPPSFAYGGMENPLLTFASPTILAGDKSLVGVLAHELAHSWSGNLVTNATARDFWLNEGFTTYVEGRVQEIVYGRERAAMEDVLDRRKLEEELSELPESDRRLHIDLAGRDPDDGVTSVPYVKGTLFLQTLEKAFGRERFDAFVRGYFDAHAFRSITTEDFRRHLEEKLLALDPKAAAGIPVERWLEGTDLPEGAPRASSAAFEEVGRKSAAWLSGELSDAGLSAAVQGWGYHERHQFLRLLPKVLPAERLGRLDAAFGLSKTGNSELAFEWLGLCVRGGYEPAYPGLELFLTSVGRGKFVKPLYKELAKTPEGRRRGREIFEKARPGYMVPIAEAAAKALAEPAAPAAN